MSMGKLRTLIGATAATAVALGGLALGGTTASAAKYDIHGIDVSGNNNSGSKTIDWKKVKKTQQFGFIKATEGQGYVSDYFKKGYKEMAAVDINRAPYHFLLGSGSGSPATQAKHFVSTIKKYGYTGKKAGEFAPVLDLEWDHSTGNCPKGVTSSGVKDFVDVLRAEFKRDPIVYTNAGFLSECDLDSKKFAKDTVLWLANYDAEPKAPAGWSDWSFWQYTSKAKVDGVPKPVDGNYFKGDKAALNKLALRK